MIWRRSHKKHEKRKKTQESKHLQKKKKSKQKNTTQKKHLHLLKWGFLWQLQKACHCWNGEKNDEANSNLVIGDLQWGPQGQIFPLIIVVNLLKVLQCKCSNTLNIEMESSKWCHCVFKLHKIMPHWHLTRLCYFIHI